MCVIAMCVPMNSHDLTDYQVPNNTCQNGGTCISPNTCQVRHSKKVLRREKNKLIIF